jgi:hypothetical protein
MTVGESAVMEPSPLVCSHLVETTACGQAEAEAEETAMPTPTPTSSSDAPHILVAPQLYEEATSFTRFEASRRTAFAEDIPANKNSSEECLLLECDAMWVLLEMTFR